MSCFRHLANQVVLQEQLKALKRARQEAKQAAKNARKQERTAWQRRNRIVKVGMLVCMLRRSFVA